MKEVVYALIGIPLTAFTLYGLWRVLVGVYYLIKSLFVLLYYVIRYGPREGWEKFHRRESEEDPDVDVPVGADIDLDL